MILIQLQEISKAYAARPILKKLNLAIADGARLGLIGANGSGKSTLLRICAGIESADTGEVTRRRGLVTSYLPQQTEPDERSPLDLLLRARSDLAAIEHELSSVAEALASELAIADLTLMDRLLERQGMLLEQLEARGGSGAAGEGLAILSKLGLAPSDAIRPMSQLSGGQRKLAALAACLARRPELLLLDEPETHLDLDGRERLEKVVGQFDGAVVIVSHDRFLLDETVSEIVELAAAKVMVYAGNYSTFAVKRELEIRRQQELYATQQREIARLEAAVTRFELWAQRVVDERHIKQAHNKQRQIDRMEKIERPVLERRKIGLELRESQRSGQKVLELGSVSLGVEGREDVVAPFDLTVWRGERVGVIGPNGSGKTLLAETLAGRRQPAGRIWTGPSVKVGYFSQHQEDLPHGTTPIEMVRGVRPMREDQAVAHLMAFLFSYEQVRQRVGDMSGGERSRLQLLLLMLSEVNCLVLDEPTNHLDIDSMEALESALERYEGTVLAVSHDRYFLDRIAERVLVIESGRLRSHTGGYSDWRELV